MLNREPYLRIYDSLPEEAKQAMRDLWDTGINDTGVWVRYGDVEAIVGFALMGPAGRHAWGIKESEE